MRLDNIEIILELKLAYTKNIKEYKSELSGVSRLFMQIVYLRLLVFIGTIFIVYNYWDLGSVIAIIALIGIVIFIYLIKRSEDLSYSKKYFKSLIAINKNELLSLEGVYSQYDNGIEYVDPQHNYSYDIDLFGEGSFFQYMNRCQTIGGADRLASGLSDPNFDRIEDRQVSIKELSKDHKWNQEYMATASLIDVDFKDVAVKEWIQDYKSVLPSYFKYILWVFPAISILLLIGVNIEILPIQAVYVGVLLGLGITGIFLKRVNIIHNDSSKITNTLRQYSKLLILIEDKKVESPYLSETQESIHKNGNKSSKIFHQLYKIFHSLDLRSNILLAIPLNGLFLTDLRAIYRLDQWMNTYKEKSLDWFECIYIFDELISCSTYNCNHPDSSFPEISTDDSLISVNDMGHPLIPSIKRIDNTYNLNDEHFTIITGANMAGKSTFLRAIGINIALANYGMPVTAAYMKYKPTRLISSMRTTDSLNKEESYFFSELKRLKYIVDQCKLSSYFIILDEILKGTNSKDKAEGSKKFLEKMRTSGSSGVIATHDLSLCELSDQYDVFNNKYFAAEIIDDELFFDYKLKEGQCKNMNASFLLKKMEII